ncbi:recombinase family protein [Nocardia sp. SYP-A9097]|uniref:recombinase family protein n=1 Tax=Nocardia sp. SYP-A9097 TaxID=2663237 RepID=UPI0018917BF9|nr:recombinase family protein [Nocardia sp. SYP-A9097]
MTDESTSPTRQLEHGRNTAQVRGWTEAGTATDLDVSATKYSPFDRPVLGDWLKNRAHEFDVIVVWRLDRLVRSSKDLADLIAWCEDNGKSLVSATEGFDLATPFGKAMVAIIAALAELEAGTLSTRVKDSHNALRKMDRWPGGQPPFGYMIVDHPRAGKTLAIDPVTSKAVRIMGEMTIADKSQWEIAARLTADGFPTPARHYHKEGASRKTEVSDDWNQSSVGKILKSPATQGFKLVGRSVKERRLARGADGMPIKYCAKGIFTDEEWNQIQAILKTRSRTRERSHGAAPLLGIVYHSVCEDRLYRASTTNPNGKTYSYYRCVPKSGKPRCTAATFVESVVQRILDDAVYMELYDLPITVRKVIPGEDHTDELEAVTRAMTSIRDEKDLGFYDYDGGDGDYRERLGALVEKRKLLQSLPQRPAEYIEEPTGETYADAYQRMNPEERRALLMKAGIRLYVTSLQPADVRLHVPDELYDALSIPKDVAERHREERRNSLPAYISADGYWASPIKDDEDK